MRGLDVLCKANIVCDNTDVISLDNGLLRSVPTIETLTARLNKTALHEGRKLGFELEKISLQEESLGPETVRYLSVEHHVDGLNELVDELMDGLNGFEVERPSVKFNAFYHPEVAVQAFDGEETRFIPQGRSYTNGGSGIIEFNIALPSEQLVGNIARELTFFALAEHAISTPSLRVVNDYHRSIFEKSRRTGLSKTINLLERQLASLEEVFQELSNRLEEGGSEFLGKLETLIRRIESVPRRLTRD